jgi:tetratricopeptide (TPR) repeat protein
VKSVRRTVCISFFFILGAVPWCLAQAGGDRTQQLYEQAKLAEQAGHSDEAIQKYQEIIKLNPGLAAAYNNLGRLYYRQGQLENAIKPLQHAIQLEPKLEPPRALLGFVFFQMENFEGARRELTAASRLNPADNSARLFLARSMVELNDLSGALKLLQQLERDDPKNTEVLYTLGGVYSSLAEVTVGKIQSVDPRSYLLELLLGKVSEIKQIYPDAAEHYKRAIERAPDVPDLYYRYAHALWAAGNPDAALAAYKDALQRNPYDYRSQWESARILLSDHPEDALRLADRALELKPDLAGALTIRGRALLSLQKPNEAIEAFKKAAALDPDDPSLHFQLARAYRLIGQTQQAQSENAIYERMDKAAHATEEQKRPAAQ